jgi:protein arginine kinase activator
MRCQVCGEREATIHYIEIVEGKKTSQWICTECADKEGITPAEVTKLAHGGLEAFLGGMLSSGPTDPTPEQTTVSLTCEVCGYSYQQLQQKGRLGCPACYRAFHRHLLPMLRRYHGDTHHVGKLPRGRGPRTSLRREIARLKLLLEQAVAQEDYELAAQLRDEIRDTERKMERLGQPPTPAATSPDDKETEPAEGDDPTLRETDPDPEE